MRFPSLQDKTILIVDDEFDILDLFRECLKSEGYTVHVFNEAVEFFKHFHENDFPSIIISDYKMPKLGGIDLIKKIREIDTEFKVKIILISAYLQDGITSNYGTDELKILKIDKILEKPIKINELIRTVKNLIEIKNPILESE